MLLLSFLFFYSWLSQFPGFLIPFPINSKSPHTICFFEKLVAANVSTTILYYQRFIGNYFPLKAMSSNPDNCDPSFDCTTSTSLYHSWATTSSLYTMDYPLISSCGSYKVFGAFHFGLKDTISFTPQNLSSHSSVTVSFDFLKIDAWTMEWFYLFIDGNIVYSINFAGDWGSNLCGSSNYYEVLVPISVTVDHSSPSLNISFFTVLARAANIESYAIRNFKLFLTKPCDLSCLTCSTTNICLTCPNFASLNSSTNLCNCMDGFYLETTNYSRCSRCDPSCQTCSGPNPTDCLTCYSLDTIQASGACQSPSNAIKLGLEFPGTGFDVSVINAWTFILGPGSGNMSTGCGEYMMVGGFYNFGVNASMMRTYNGLTIPHYQIGIRLDFYKIDSWDFGELFILTVDGTKKTWNYNNYPDSVYVRNLCGNNFVDAITLIDVQFPHTATSVTINMTSSLDTAPYDESWGVSNFQLNYLLCHPTCLTCSGGLSTHCLSCYLNASLASGQCLCDSGFVMNNYTNPCQGTPCSYCCHSLCFLCVEGNCHQCPVGYNLQDNGCFIICPTGCASCQNSSSLICLTCLSGYYLTSSNTCETACLIGYYQRDSDKTCQKCDSSCRGCTAGDSLSCTECNSSYYLSSGQCLACDLSCSTCQGSSSNCSSCSGSLYLISSQCLSSCPSNYYKSSSLICELCDKQCVQCSDSQNCTVCSSNQLLYQGKCLLCDPECLTCSGATNNCLSCPSGTFLNSSKCLTKCPNGFYGDSINKICQTCDPSCVECSISSTNCTKCLSGSVLLSGSCQICVNCLTCATSVSQCLSCPNGKFLFNANCLTSCLTAYYPDTASRACLPCDFSCVTCYGPSETQCLSCLVSQFLDSGGCFACDLNCLTCSQVPTYCQSCLAPLALYDNECVASCPNGYFLNNNTLTCDLCNPACVTCDNSSSSSCLTCVFGSYLSNKQCFLCPAGCVACTAATNCSSCKILHYLYNFQCFDNCAKGFYRDITDNQCKTCDSSCVDCTGPTLHECIECLNNQALVAGICYFCDPNCTTCKGIGAFDCLSCPSPNYLQESTCVSQCGQSYYPVTIPQRVCIRCSYQCKQCFGGNDTQCTQCNATQFLNVVDTTNSAGSCYQNCPSPLINDITNYKCTTKCPAGKFLLKSINQCQACDTTCLTCNGVNPTDCLNCIPAMFLLNGQCLGTCPDSYFSEIVNNGANGICSSCSQNCLRCQNQNQCVLCNNGYYVSTADASCVNCTDIGLFISGLTCGFCSEGCAECVNSENCTTCVDSYYLKKNSCFVRTYIQPNLTNDQNIDHLYYLNFNSSWPMLFGNLTYNKSSYGVKINGVSSIKDYKYILKPYIFQKDTWELLLNVTVDVPENSSMTFTFYPPDEALYYLTPNTITLPLGVYFYCGYLKIFDYTINNCTNLTVITPSLSLQADQAALLSFSGNFSELTTIFSNITSIYLENIPKSNYNFTPIAIDLIHYHLSLSFNQSLLNKPLLIVTFDLPGYIILHPLRRLVPTTLSIVMGQFYLISSLAGEVLGLQKTLDNGLKNMLFFLAMFQTLLGFSGLNAMGIIAIEKIKYLRYLDLNYPPNALSVFESLPNNISLFNDFLDVSQVTNKLTLPPRFVAYKVEPNFLVSAQEEIGLLIILLTIGVIIKTMTRNTKCQSIRTLQRIFFLNAPLFALNGLLLDLTFHCVVSLYWHSLSSSKGAINFMLAFFTMVSLIISFFFIGKKLSIYCPSDDSLNYHKAEDKIEDPKSVLSNSNREMSVFSAKSPTLGNDSFGNEKRKNFYSQKTVLKGSESQNYSLVAKPTMSKKVWWDEKDKDQSASRDRSSLALENSTIIMSRWEDKEKESGIDNSEGYIGSSKRERRGVSFRNNTEKIIYDPYRSISVVPKEDWGFIKVLTQDFQYKTITERLFVLYAMIRDSLYALILVICSGNAYLGLSCLTILNVFFILIFLIVRPFKSGFDFLVFMCLEVCVGVSILAALVIVLADQGEGYDEQQRMDKGWIIYYGYLISVMILLIRLVWGLMETLIKACKKFNGRKKMDVVPIC